MFKFVLIPAKEDAPIQEFTADSSGGLSDDALVKHAKKYFHELTGAKSRLETIAKASPEERKMLAQQVRNQMKGALDSQNIDDDTLLDTIYRNQSIGSCDITALTVPVPGNSYQAVSMYAADQAKESGLSLNKRATSVLTACGHAANNGGVYGDVFLGRAHDNEASDVWKRMDFTVKDADSGADWCRIARSRTGGGGSGGKAAAASLSGLLQSGNAVQTIDTSATAASGGGAAMFGQNGAPPVQESWGSWTQTNDEIELVFQVEAGTKAKDCKVKFRPRHVSVSVKGSTVLDDVSLFDPIVPDECTFTLQDAKDHRELIVTLTKSEPRTWSWAIQMNK
ncbi:hypothetical protein ACA910_000991 [Epithemia clementina (nom. ined.)]